MCVCVYVFIYPTLIYYLFIYSYIYFAVLQTFHYIVQYDLLSIKLPIRHLLDLYNEQT